MQHLIENNEIVKSGIPRKFTRQNGELFCGGYQNKTSIHFEDGWREEVIPDFDGELEYLGGIYYDEVNEVVTYHVIPIDFDSMDIEEIRAEKHDEFMGILESEMTPALMFGVIDKLAMGEPIPAETIAVITALRTREAQVKADIDAITDTKALKQFGFDRTEIEQSKKLLKDGRKL
jgi:hypothetical protein